MTGNAHAVFRLGETMLQSMDWMDQNWISYLFQMSQSLQPIQTDSRKKYQSKDWLPQILFSPFQIFINFVQSFSNFYK